MNIRFIVQARLQSLRLPEKVLADIGGYTLLQHIIKRLRKIDSVQFSTLFAIPKESSNKLQDYFNQNQIQYIEGSNSDVMSRFLTASEDLNDNDYVVRLTADNPFLDYECANFVLKKLKNSQADLIYPWKLPLGMGFEIIRTGALRDQREHSLEPHHFEHVSTYIKENREQYKVQKIDYIDNRSDIRLTVDEAADLEQVKKTYDYFVTRNKPYFTSVDICKLHADKPSFFTINKKVAQKTPTSYEKESFQ